MALFFHYCPDCELVLVSKQLLDRCPLCGRADLHEAVIDEEVYCEDVECPRCGEREVYDLYTGELLVYPGEKKALAGARSFSWYCANCGKSDTNWDSEEINYPVHLVDLTWEEFLRELLGLPEKAFSENTKTLIYLPDYSELVDINRCFRIRSTNDYGYVELANFRAFEIRKEQQLARFDYFRDKETLKKHILVVDSSSGELLYQGEEVPVEALI